MIKAALYGKGRANLHKALSEHLPFTTSGAMRGNTVHAPNGTPPYRGWLSDHEFSILRADAEEFNIAYVVYSYNTPIAWVRKDGSVYRVEQRFSTTTSRHQGTLYLLG